LFARFCAQPSGKIGAISGAWTLIRFQRGLETSDEAVRVAWLGQVANRSSRKRVRTGLLIREGREENKRNAAAFGTQMILQLDAAHARHLDVRDDTREVVNAARPQELFGG